MMSLKDLGIGAVRTAVPGAVGYLLMLLSTAGIEVDAAALEVVITGLFVGVYWLIVAALSNLHPKIGILLGWAATPHYDERRLNGQP